MAESKGLFGDTYVTEDKAVCIPIERYNELIKKEAFYDELTKHNIISVALLSNVMCAVKDEEDNN